MRLVAYAGIPVIPPPRNPHKTGGHAFAIVGYNERGFIVQNSWGEGWGASGFAILPYGDWGSRGSDAWAVALGVPQDLSVERIEALRWPAQSGRSLGFFDLTVRNRHNPPDDPWPIDREYEHTPYEPWSTAKAYSHTLVTGNDGHVVITDLTPGVAGDQSGFVNDLVVEQAGTWLKRQGSPRLMIYAHGGLNAEQSSTPCCDFGISLTI